MIYFVKDCEYELADYIKKHEIVNTTGSRLTRAIKKVRKHAD